MSEVETQNGLNLLVKSSFFMLFIIVLSKIISYFYKIFIAREFGPEYFGLFSLAMIIISITGGIFLLGLPDALVRYLSFYFEKKELSKAKAVLKYSFIFMAIASVITLVLYFLFSGFVEDLFNEKGLSYFLKILALSIPPFLFLNILLSYMRSSGKVNSSSFFNNFVQNFLKLLFLIIFFYMGLGEKSLVYSYSIAIFCTLLIVLYFSRKDLLTAFKEKNLKTSARKKLLSEILNFSWPLLLMSVVLNLYYWTDSIIIGYLKSSVDVGFYSAATTLTFLFAISQDLFIQMFFPLIAKEYSKKRIEVVRNITKQVTKWMFLINLPLFFLIFFFPGVFINLFFGQEYFIAGEILKILSIGAMISTFNGLFITLLTVKGHSKLILVDFVSFIILNIILDIIFISKWGLSGVALATTISFALLTLVLTVQVKRKYKFFPLKRTIIKITLISIIPFAIMFFLSNKILPTLNNLIISLIIFILTYIVLLYLTKCFDEYDFHIIKSAIGKIRPH